MVKAGDKQEKKAAPGKPPKKHRFTKENAAEMAKRKKGPYPKMSRAATVRAIKRKAAQNPEALNEIEKIMADPNYSIQKILNVVQEMDELSVMPKDKNLVAQRLADAHKLHHGDKKIVDMRSVNVNMDVAVSEDRMRDILGDDYEN